MSGLDNVRYTRARAGFLYWIVYLNRALELRPVGRPNSRFIPSFLGNNNLAGKLPANIVG